MAKYIIRYLLEGDGTVPVFVEDGGYLPINEEYVGISIDDTKRYLPSSIQKLTEQQLIDRANSLNLRDVQAEVNSILSKI